MAKRREGCDAFTYKIEISPPIIASYGAVPDLHIGLDHSLRFANGVLAAYQSLSATCACRNICSAPIDGRHDEAAPSGKTERDYRKQRRKTQLFMMDWFSRAVDPFPIARHKPSLWLSMT